MPIQTCTMGGKKGTKYGEGGACYTGKDQRRRAEAQKAAIRHSQRRRGQKVK